ncbi:UNVERIFIED_CONTAM: hypothetical protein H355_015567 [Colinus virginianus]|nr:hypothetical protein H355_015567 [Colinus virginianus]
MPALSLIALVSLVSTVNYVFRQGKGEKHKGVDVICSDGATVYAPFSGQLSGPIRFFHNGNAIDDGVQISGSGKRNGKGGKHKGVDVICADGATVYAPFSGELFGPVKFFHNGNAIDDGIQIKGSGFCVKLLCIHPIRYHGRISKGQVLGRMLPMQRVFPGITSHIHVENCDHSDPTSNLERGKGRRK